MVTASTPIPHRIPAVTPIIHAINEYPRNSAAISLFLAPRLIFIPISCFALMTAVFTLVPTEILHTTTATQDTANRAKKAAFTMLSIVRRCLLKFVIFRFIIVEDIFYCLVKFIS